MQVRNIRILASAFIILFFLIHLSDWQRWPLIERMDNILYDWRLKISTDGQVDPRIIIIDINEESLAIEGRWPWNRDRIALLIDNLLTYYGIDMLGIDIVFAEHTEISGKQVIKQLEKSMMADNSQLKRILKPIKQGLEHDQRLAEAIAKGRVILGFTESDYRGIKGALSLPIETKIGVEVALLDLYEAYGFSGNLKVLNDSAKGAGFFSNPAVVDELDGVYRRAALLLKYENKLYPGLTLAMLHAYLESNDAIGLRINPDLPTIVNAIKVGNRVIPTGKLGTVLVPYKGGKGTFRYISALDILQRKLDRNALEGSIAFLGTSAPGLNDLRSTPVDAAYPGVEIHANLLSGMLNHSIRSEPDYTKLVKITVFLLFSIGLSLIFMSFGPAWGTLFFSSGLALIWGLSEILWQKQIFLPLTGVIIGSILLFLFHAIYGYFTEILGKHQLTRLFGQYIPEELVENMAKNPEKFTLKGQQKQMTVLFSDIRGFTTLATNLTPAELSDLMDEFLTPLTQIIHSHKGTIDKYMGDAIMAFWNAPVDDPKHAKNALLAAMEMISKMQKMAPEFKSHGLPPLKIGIGINTGEMNVGNMGSKFRMAYTVLGDAVNLGSRLEGVTKEYGVDIIVGEDTKNAVPDMIFRELDKVEVKGRPIPVVIFEPVCLKTELDEITQQALQLFAEVLAAYRQCHWTVAKDRLTHLIAHFPEHKVYNLYLQRVNLFLKDDKRMRTGDPIIPGENWDGVFKLKTK